ncbi:MAG: haloacid dehalogenase-like hydrolase [Gammaproteobacteria bacterium]|nr:haloacid dehalogenase-like hydrolase [Gammaproteobacteria bacterium]
MSAPLFSQNIIALVWDFDKTLIPGYMQEPLFRHYGVDAAAFWAEVNELPAEYLRRGVELTVSEILYLNHILDYTRRGIFAGLNNARLRAFGAELEFYPGLPEFFTELKQTVAAEERYAGYDITLEHYVVSTGLRQMILGSAIAGHLDGVWGCELLEDEHEGQRLVSQLGYVLDNTTKTRAVFEINKGVNKHPGAIDVNAQMADSDRRVPFRNMIYVADGPSDVPVFSVLNRNGGVTYAVYRRGSAAQLKQVNQLLRDRRVQAFGEADYTPGSQTSMWLSHAVTEVAERIVQERQRAMQEKVSKPPRHLNE